MRKIRTVGDVRDEKIREDIGLGTYLEMIFEKKRVADILDNHPQIGVLCREGKNVYYVNSPEYIESDDPKDLIV